MNHLLPILLLALPLHAQPWLAIAVTNVPVPVPSLSRASLPIIVDGTNIQVGQYQTDIEHAVACGQCLVVTLYDSPGSVNELLWSTNLTHWTSTNVRWVIHDQPVSYFIPHTDAVRFYRSKRGSRYL